MYKIEKLKSLLDCDQCKKLIVKPVFTACGYSVCKSYVDKLDKFKCELCDMEHEVPRLCS